MKRNFFPFLLKPGLLLAIYISAALLISFLKFHRSYPGDYYTKYNNYQIFSTSFSHLVKNQDLYVGHPEDHFDYYKYSPAFALLMAPFKPLPPLIGLMIWNLLNALALFFAVSRLRLPMKDKMLMLWIIFPELVKCIENSQSNGLIAGMIVASFNLMENKKLFAAALLISLSGFIKIFGIAAGMLFLLYPNRIKSMTWLALSVVLLTFLPLVVVSPHQLVFLYQSWGNLLANDHSASLGISVMGWLHSWFALDMNKMLLVIIGALLLCIPLFRIEKFSSPVFRMKLLASVLIWILIFNHKAESPTLVVAVTGIAAWYFTEKWSILNFALLASAILFTVLPSTDIFPSIIRENYVTPLNLQAVPCILIWIKVTSELIFRKRFEEIPV